MDQALINVALAVGLGRATGKARNCMRFLKIAIMILFSRCWHTNLVLWGRWWCFLLLFVVYRCFRIASKAPDVWALIAYGCGVLMAFQTLVNVGVNFAVAAVPG